MRRKPTKIVNLSELVFERDKQKAKEELTDYFVKKDRQVKAAQLVSALKSSLRKRLFSVAEAEKLIGYLAKTFDMRRPAIQYAQAGYLSPRVKVVKDCIKPKVTQKNQIQRTFFPSSFYDCRLQCRITCLTTTGLVCW